jgi:hypothetical protein
MALIIPLTILMSCLSQKSTHGQWDNLFHPKGSCMKTHSVPYMELLGAGHEISGYK